MNRPLSSDRQKAVSRRWRAARTTAVALIALTGVRNALHVSASQAEPTQSQLPAPTVEISSSAWAQISSLVAEKASRTPAQRKVDSQLIYAAKIVKGLRPAAGVRDLEVQLPFTSGNRVTLDVSADVDDALLDQLRSLGAVIVDARPGSVRLSAELAQVDAIAGLPQVIFVQPKQEAITARVGRPAPRRLSASPPAHNRGRERAAILTKLQSTGLLTQTPSILVGSKQSEGDTTHRASRARSTYGLNGTGVKIGVLSNGVTSLAASQALGDLGAVTVLPGQAGNGDEGTAMLEIIHDLAPGAQLYFATAFSSIASFAQNIRALRALGCDIIVDDVSYYVETPFQDGQTIATNTNGGVVIQAVKDVVADGALYFSSAGNSGNHDAGTSGTWEGDFVDGGASAAGQLHSFGALNYNTISSVYPNYTTFYTLFWSDPLGASANDYDLFRLNSTGTTILASSTNIQNGTQDPFESITDGALGNLIVVVKYSGAARFLHLSANRDRLSIATSGQTRGHSATTASNSFGVAATPATSPGPYPGAFHSGNSIEAFSSDGPRRIFFNANGSAITPDNLGSTGGQVLAKPNFTAADGVAVTGVGGFPSPFYGTSAAAPHAAAIAALVKSANLSLTASQVRGALIASAIDIQAVGVDRNSGVGVIMADTAVASVFMAPAITVQPASQVIASGQTASLSVTATGTAPVTYQWYSGTSGNTSTPIRGATSNSYTTPPLISDTRHWVRVLNAGGSVDSITATVSVVFTDATLTAGSSSIRLLHVAELRQRIDALRGRFGLLPYAWVDVTLVAGVTPIKAQHILNLRQALAEVYSKAGFTPPTYTDPELGLGTTMQVAHISELRAAVRAIE